MNCDKLRIYGGSDYAVTDDEVVVTPEMASAGAEILSDYDPRYDSLHKTAREIYLAMAAAKKRAASKT